MKRNKKINGFKVLIELMLISNLALSQEGNYFFTKDKTQHIYTDEKLPSYLESNIAIIPAIVFSGYVTDNAMKRIQDSLFDAHVSIVETKGNIDKENRFIIKCYHDYYDLFEDKMNYYITPVNANDQKIISEELKRMEQILKDSSVTTFKISDRLFSVLSNYPATHYLLTDICDYYQYWHFYKGAHNIDYFMIKYFLVDAKNGTIIFYDYEIRTPFGYINNPLTKLKTMFPEENYSLRPPYTR